MSEHELDHIGEEDIPTFKVELPPSELGNDRCFAAKYFGHGDNFIAQWNGEINQTPNTDDHNFKAFNFRHGSDVTILSTLAGYLKRIGRDEDQIKETFYQSGRDILEEEYSLDYDMKRFVDQCLELALGEDYVLYDREELGLKALSAEISASPTNIDLSGGTGIYTKANPNTEDHYVLAHILPLYSSEGSSVGKIAKTAEFCPADIPTMAKAICQMSMGSYRDSIHGFLDYLYSDDNILDD